MPLKVSVVVPVFNPGSHIDELIESLLGQTLPADEFEAVFVDDGSTDGTPERLEALAERHSHFSMRRIPPSGWPGRPRNLGTDLARGDFVLYVDNDDWLAHDALERLHARAIEADVDIVVGKVVGHGRSISPALFERNRIRVGIEWACVLRGGKPDLGAGGLPVLPLGAAAEW